MADVVAAPQVAPAPEEEPQGVLAVLQKIFMKMMMVFFFVNLFKGFTRGGNEGPVNGTGTVRTTHSPAQNIFSLGTKFDLIVYLNENPEKFKDFDIAQPFWIRKSLTYGDWDSEETFTNTFDTPPALLKNQSYYLHLFIVRSGGSPNPKDRGYVKRELIYHSKQLNKFKKKFYKKTANLLTGKSDQSEEDLKKAETLNHEILNFWHPNLTINVVVDHTPWIKGQTPSPLDEAVIFDKLGLSYQPIVMLNDYWNLGSEYQPVNNTVEKLNLTLTYQPQSLFRFQLYASQQMRSKWSKMLSGDLDEGSDDQDTIKQALLDTNPVLLGVTIVVSLLHTVFEFLAFKNDIQFWKNRKSLVGLSVRSVLFGVFQSLIVFLYICDNDTNVAVKLSVFIGLLIECWKVPMCMNVEWSRTEKWLGIIPKIKISDKGTYIESDTRQYDELAFKYLSWGLYPLLAGYAVYSLMYVEQKGWYSWVLSMLYGFLLTFGFIMMTPQLFINYKLKSVAHLPWRMLTYKFINTFIDDLFAFVIRMPTMYRIGVFRDDIVFLIYIYQRWIYRVDPTRTNEYGTSGEDPTGAVTAQQGETAAAITEGGEAGNEGESGNSPQQSEEEKKTN